MGLEITTRSFVLGAAILLATSATAEEVTQRTESDTARVVSMQQPISYSTSDCTCSACAVGDPQCRRAGNEESQTPEDAAKELLAGEDMVAAMDLMAADDLLSAEGLMAGNDQVVTTLGTTEELSDNDSVVPASFAHVCNATDPDCNSGSCSGCPTGCSDSTCNASSCEGGGMAHLAPACGPSCTRCDGLGQCGGLVVSTGPFVWSNCSGCPTGCSDCDRRKQGPLRRLLQHARGKGCVDCGCLNLCSKRGLWVRGESILWWGEDVDLPSLATSSPSATPIGDVGVLGLPTTTDLYGGSFFGDMRPGVRIRFGWWGDQGHHGLDGSVWGVRNDRDERVWESSGDPAYARPFFNVDPLVNAEDAELVSYPNVLDGRLQINTSSDIMGGDLGIRKNLYSCSSSKHCQSVRIDCYAGYRYFKVREGLRVTENLESTALGGPVVLGTTIDLFDDFRVRNEFHGANFGFVAAKQSGRWSTEIVSRVGLGNLAREVRINGATTVTVPTLAPSTRAGGLLTQPSNIGTYEDDEFAVVSELQLNLLYNIRCNMRAIVGYNFMFLGEVTRLDDVVDRNVNGLHLDPTLPFAGPNRPQFTWNDNNDLMWLMGLNLGIECTF